MIVAINQPVMIIRLLLYVIDYFDSMRFLYKVIQNITPLVDDKSKFREWNRKFVSAMGQVNPAYEQAMKNIMHWADAEISPDPEHGWPSKGGVAGIGDVEGLKIDELDQDLKSVLMEKAAGTVHTRVMNGESQGGIHVYIDVYDYS